MMLARLLCVVACCAWLIAGGCFAACSKDDADPAGGQSGHPHAKDASTPAADKDAGHSSGGSSGGSRADGGGVVGDSGSDVTGDASGGSGGSGGSNAEGDPSKCGGVSCPEPSVCDRAGNPPFCVCPPGYHFVDVGGNEPPCAANCNDDCDGG